jgi:hypothetical protein
MMTTTMTAISGNVEAAPASATDIKKWTDREVLDACIANNQRAWRELLRRYDGPLRGAVYKRLHHLEGRIPSDYRDDVMGAFWLKVVDRNMGALRSFDWNEGKALYKWFAKLVNQCATEYATMMLDHMDYAPIENAHEVPDEGGVLASGREPIRGSLSAYVRREKAKRARAEKNADRARRRKLRGDRLRQKRAAKREEV